MESVSRLENAGGFAFAALQLAAARHDRYSYIA
jgi:hypothetical protein